MNLFSRTNRLESLKKSASRSAGLRRCCSLEQLEDRRLMAVSNFALNDVTGKQIDGLDRGKISAQVADQRMGLPMLDSLPGAPRTLYLDFNGNFEGDWWQTYKGNVDHYYNLFTPAYNTDGVPGLFSTTEQQEIREIWAAVAEDFAPFNINVTTNYYGTLEDGKALKVVIGGNDNWLKRDVDENISGTSEIRSYLTSAPNTVFVFSENFSTGAFYRMQIAATASHEAGHAYSLVHRSVWSADGKTVTEPYDFGTDVWTPIMGHSNSADRTTWSRGVTEQGPYTWQDDFAILGGLLGFRADEPSISTLASSATTAFNSPLFASGLINTTTDVDVFQFTTGGGQINITVKAAPIGPNLIPRAELWSASNLIKTGTFDGPTQSLIAPKTSVIDVSLAAGTYFVRVKGGSDYGNMGQYSVSVSTKLLTTAVLGGKTNTLVVGPVVKGTTSSVATANPVTTKLLTTNPNKVIISPAPARASDSLAVSGNAPLSLLSKSAPTKMLKLTPSTGRLQTELMPASVDAAFADLWTK